MPHDPDAVATPARRRGAVLERAIYRATLAELAASGYAALTMDGVARRARTGKAALYRRWASKRELVLDGLLHAVPDPRAAAPSGSIRDKLLAELTIIADTMAGRGGNPGLDVLVEVVREPELRAAFGEQVIGPRRRLIEDILRNGADRGEIVLPPGTGPLIARTGPALVIEAVLRTGAAPSRAELAAIVDSVLLPLLTAGRTG